MFNLKTFLGTCFILQKAKAYIVLIFNCFLENLWILLHIEKKI